MPRRHPAVSYFARIRPTSGGWALLAVASVVVAIVAYGQVFYALPAEGMLSAAPRLALSLLATACAAVAVALWLALAAAVFRVALRHPVRGTRMARNAALLSALGCALLLGHLAFRLGGLYLAGTQSLTDYYRALTTSALLLFLYLSLVGLLHALDFALRYQRKATAELRLRAELAETELMRMKSEMRSLKLELNPHFVLNTLNSVSALVSIDPPRARHVVVRLGDLLRSTLESSELEQVTLAEEIRQLRPYVEIQEVRFGSRLRVEWEVDGGAMGMMVPHMVLQPLVENAIKHGIGAMPEGGVVRIRAWTEGNGLHLEVCDDGPGPGGAPECGRGGGVGLANVRSRLANAYGNAARFELAAAPGRGAVASIVVPAVPAQPTPAAALHP
ncbi:MAG: histidine kinase, partial [Gemmatimonadetes bacterium]|nr:histidine kinase [Gemmatimonadota bacterium]